jgi:diguanylate cyclase (GGDEF)-like protein
MLDKVRKIFKSTTQSESESTSQSEGFSEPELLRILLSDILDFLGVESFDTDALGTSEIRKFFRSWAAHVRWSQPFEKVFKRYPFFDYDKGETKLALEPLMKFIKSQRLAEKLHVQQSRRHSQKLIWGLFEQMKENLLHGTKETALWEREYAKIKESLKGFRSSDLSSAVEVSLQTLDKLLLESKQYYEIKLSQLDVQLSEIQKTLESAMNESRIDGLTRLFNRKYFELEMERLVDENNFSKKKACLVIIDIDHFKKVNDTWGHAAGDEVLKGVGSLCSMRFSNRDDVVARFGGEEIVVLLPGVEINQARNLALQLRQSIKEKVFVYGQEKISVTVSMGIAEIAKNDLPEKWFERADKALYKAKGSGRDRIILA